MFIERVRRHFRFDVKELLQLSVTAFAFALVMGLRSIESLPVEISYFIKLISIMFVLSFLALFIHFGFEKLYAIRHGMDVTYIFNPIALGIGTYLGTLIFNLVFFLSPGYFRVKGIKKQRIGRFRYRLSFRESSSMAMTGIMGTLLVAGILSYFKDVPIIGHFIEISLFIAILSLLPIPRNDGFHIFMGDWYHYAFIVVFTLSFVLLLYFLGFIYTLLISIIFGCIGFLELFKKI